VTSVGENEEKVNTIHPPLCFYHLQEVCLVVLCFRGEDEDMVFIFHAREKGNERKET